MKSLHQFVFVNGDRAELTELPARAVALDGYVQGPVPGDAEDRWSFDHHANVIRLITAATCEQVYVATVLGFEWEGRKVYINDLDGDTILSMWLIVHRDRVAQPRAAERETLLVRDLVRAVGAVDAHGPSGKLLLGELEQVLVEGFFQGALAPLEAVKRELSRHFDRWPDLVVQCFEGIDRLVRGETQRVATATPPRVTILHETEGMVLARSDGPGAFEVLYPRYPVVALVDAAAEGTYRYTIGKRSDLVPYPLRALLTSLNAQEPGWGGGTSIGGSPRKPGGGSSRLSPVQVWWEMRRFAG